jgi:hypothetical protein
MSAGSYPVLLIYHHVDFNATAVGSQEYVFIVVSPPSLVLWCRFHTESTPSIDTEMLLASAGASALNALPEAFPPLSRVTVRF